MGWSTAELAAIAGTSLRAVRHYHDVGLLAEPERRANGWKRYGLDHLVRVVRIRRLVDLGFTLAEIDDVDRAGDDALTASLQRIDDELTASIERLQRARSDVATLLATPGRDVALPPGADLLADVPMCDGDRDLVVLMSRLASPRGFAAYVDRVRAAYAEPVLVELTRLAADADAATCEDLAQRLVAPRLRQRALFPPIRDLLLDADLGPDRAYAVFETGLLSEVTPADRVVLDRVEELVAAAG